MRSNRVAIVTGAGNGLGAEFARALAADGATVVVNNRRHPNRPFSADEVVAHIRATGGNATTDDHAVDAPGAAEAIVTNAVATQGRLDALILNAGISGPAIKIGAGDTALDEVMAINFFANARLVEAALPALVESPAGRIVFVSSTGGLHGVRGRAAYAASKSALNGYALSLADELRHSSTRVNIIAPYAATKMTAQPGRSAHPALAPKGAAALLGWLASPACERTGEIWVAGGDRVRAARAMESASAGFDPNALDRLAAMPNAQGYPGGEAAFADFYRAMNEEMTA